MIFASGQTVSLGSPAIARELASGVICGMTLAEIDHHICGLPQVTASSNFGYRFFFYADEQKLPFATLASSDNEYDKVSQLDREGIYRLNIGVSRESFAALFSDGEKAWDYGELNRWMPHPHYAAQFFICVLNPSGDTLDQALRYLKEAHAIGKNRSEKKSKN